MVRTTSNTPVAGDSNLHFHPFTKFPCGALVSPIKSSLSIAMMVEYVSINVRDRVVSMFTSRYMFCLAAVDQIRVLSEESVRPQGSID